MQWNIRITPTRASPLSRYTLQASSNRRHGRVLRSVPVLVLVLGLIVAVLVLAVGVVVAATVAVVGVAVLVVTVLGLGLLVVPVGVPAVGGRRRCFGLLGERRLHGCLLLECRSGLC